MKIWRAIQNHRKQQQHSTTQISSHPTISINSNNLSSQHCANNSNFNSFDSNSNHTNSSDDYESCNGSN